MDQAFSLPSGKTYKTGITVFACALFAWVLSLIIMITLWPSYSVSQLFLAEYTAKSLAVLCLALASGFLLFHINIRYTAAAFFLYAIGIAVTDFISFFAYSNYDVIMVVYVVAHYLELACLIIVTGTLMRLSLFRRIPAAAIRVFLILLIFTPLPGFALEMILVMSGFIGSGAPVLLIGYLLMSLLTYFAQISVYIFLYRRSRKSGE